MRKILLTCVWISAILIVFNCSSNYTKNKNESIDIMSYTYDQQYKYLPDSLCADKSSLYHIDDYTFSYFQHIAIEPSIYEQRKDSSITTFRFTWFRTFHQAIAIRFFKNDDHTGTLIIKKSDGQSGFSFSKLEETRTAKLSEKQVREFLYLVNEVGFWELPNCYDEAGYDGADWIIEGLQNGKYHVSKTWSPEDGPIRELGLFLINHSGLRINRSDIY